MFVSETKIKKMATVLISICSNMKMSDLNIVRYKIIELHFD